MLDSDHQRYRSIVDLIGDDEDLARAVRMELEERFGWSLVYYDEIELCHRFATNHGYDEASDVPDDIWNELWPLLRDKRFWRDALWLDDFAGDRIDHWLSEEEKSIDPALRERIEAWDAS